MDNEKLEETQNSIEKTIIDIISPLFYDEVKNFKILNSYNLNTNNVFIIKILPLETPLVVVPKNVKSEIIFQKIDKILKLNIIELLISEPIKIEKYQKNISQTKIFSRIPLISIGFENYDILSQFTIVIELLYEIKKSLKNALMEIPIGNFNLQTNKDQLIQMIRISETDIRKFVDYFFLGISGIPWDIDELFYSLDKVSFQFLITKLVGRLSEDEISSLILYLDKSGTRILQNISKITKERIHAIKGVTIEKLISHKNQNLNLLKQDLPIEEIIKIQSIEERERSFSEIARFHASIELNKILTKNNDTPFSTSLKELRDTFKKVFYSFRTSKEVFSKVLKLLDELENPLEILNYIPRNELPKALVDIPENNLTPILSRLSPKGQKQLLEDIEFFSKNQKDFSKERGIFIDAVIKCLFKQQLKTKNIWQILSEIIPKLSPTKIYYAIYETKLSTFLIFTEALYNLPKREEVPKEYKTTELYEEFTKKLEGIAKITLENFINGNLNFTFAYGETKINESIINFSEQLYFTVKMDEILE